VAYRSRSTRRSQAEMAAKQETLIGIQQKVECESPFGARASEGRGKWQETKLKGSVQHSS
jgi:hypothetical protein